LHNDSCAFDIEEPSSFDIGKLLAVRGIFGLFALSMACGIRSRIFERTQIVLGQNLAIGIGNRIFGKCALATVNFNVNWLEFFCPKRLLLMYYNLNIFKNINFQFRSHILLELKFSLVIPVNESLF